MLSEIATALADAVTGLAVNEDLNDLQVEPFMLVNPTPPSVDIFPADPSQDDAAFGPVSRQTFWTIRARVNTVDHENAQAVLLSLMEPSGATSLRSAIQDDDGVAEACDGVKVDGPSGFRLYQNPAPTQDLEAQGVLLGVEWRVLAYTKTGDES